MKGILISSITVFICSLLNYWGFLILEIGAGNTPSAGPAQAFWVLNTILLLGYLLINYSVPTLILSVFHFAFLTGSVAYFSEINLFIPIFIEVLLFIGFIFFVKQKASLTKLNPIAFVILLAWLLVVRSLIN